MRSISTPQMLEKRPPLSFRRMPVGTILVLLPLPHKASRATMNVGCRLEFYYEAHSLEAGSFDDAYQCRMIPHMAASNMGEIK
jgi:hypothetical protein